MRRNLNHLVPMGLPHLRYSVGTEIALQLDMLDASSSTRGAAGLACLPKSL
jgi:hypothetical protein